MDRQNRPCAHCRPMQAISPLPVAVMSVLNLPQSCNSKLKKGTVYTPHSPSSLTDSPTCALGKIAKTCNTDCVTTCSSSRDDCPTITECVPGCFCQQGTVEFEDICLAEEQCPAEPSLLQYLPFYCSSSLPSGASVHPLLSLSTPPSFPPYGSTNHSIYLLNSS